MADLSDPALGEALALVRSDVAPQTYCIFGYEGKTKIVCKARGGGSCYAAMDEMSESEVSYALLRVANTRDQESKSVKFVFVVYTGPAVGASRVGSHKGDVKAFIGQSHVDIQTDDMDDLSEAAITEKLKKASGANYDLGSNAGGQYKAQAGGIQAQARANYQTLEKTGNIGVVAFNAKSHVVAKSNVTAMDLGGRPMVAPSSAAQKNVVVRDEAARQKAIDESAARAELARLRQVEATVKPASPPKAPPTAPPPATLAPPPTPAAPPPPTPAAPPPPPPAPPIATAASGAKESMAPTDSPANAFGGTASALAAYPDKVVVLYTSMTRDQLATVATRKIVTQLEGLHVPFVELDGTQPTNKDVRSALWSLAGAKPGTYPIVFVGPTGFVCHGDAVQDLIDSGEMEAKLTGNAVAGEQVAAPVEAPVTAAEPAEEMEASCSEEEEEEEEEEEAEVEVSYSQLIAESKRIVGHVAGLDQKLDGLSARLESKRMSTKDALAQLVELVGEETVEEAAGAAVAAEKVYVPASSPLLTELGVLGERLGRLGDSPAARPPSKVHPDATQADVLAALESLVEYAEAGAGHVMLSTLARLTSRLEARAGIVAPAGEGAAAGLDGMADLTKQLAGFVGRLEVAAGMPVQEALEGSITYEEMSRIPPKRLSHATSRHSVHAEL